MKPTYLKPRADGTVRLIVSVFTNGEMEDVPANSPYFNQAAPITTNIEISQEGLFDLDVIEKIIKQHMNPKTLRWTGTGGKRPVFVPFGKKSSSEIPEHMYDRPAPAKGEEDLMTGRPLLVLKDAYARSVQGEGKTTVAVVEIGPCLDPKDDAKVPGLPVVAKIGEKKDVGVRGDVMRFTVGRLEKMALKVLTRLPVPVDIKKTLPIAQNLATTRSPWIHEPPTEIEFETSMLEILKIEEELKGSGVPAEVTMLGKRLCVYATDRGNAYCPEAMNYKTTSKGQISGGALWSIGRDGKVFKPTERPNDPMLGMAIIYGGPSYILRFVTGGNNIFYHNCAAYVVQPGTYIESMSDLRPDLVKDWDPPPVSEGNTWFFMTSDWCMRNDANVKRGAAGMHASRASIDLYSRPHLSLKRWIHGPFRAKYRDTAGGVLPGTKVHKSTVSSADLQNLLKHAAVHGGEQFAGLQQAMALPKPKKKE